VSETILVIQQGESEPSDESLVFLDTGMPGTPGAPRRLVYPDFEPLLPPVVYAVTADALALNPDRTLGFDLEPLPHPLTAVRQTLASTRIIRFERALEDVVVTEVWLGEGGISMPAAFLRLLYEYLRNPPPSDQPIVWEPRDRTERRWYVELLSLSVGGGADDEGRFDLVDLREPGGLANGGSSANGTETLWATPSGLIDREVRMRMRILAEVE
jgi:hypothetical protein